ncbi:ABC transporter ATP-binding protein [Zwartia panacis]|uniref:ABC transporter ATP-binding protein n=1 Tax=Zwartia panacis TaxID=2683345 RepID=UPI0025B2F892|nr:ABC transporter ATP-binding protein [Zwartia panacis]MDN4016865.1 ABC transporter ATP-binding protein [Zwartia panacis]
MNAATNAIVVNRLCKRVSDASGMLNILDDVSFTVTQGQSIAITGASGSGKSTLLGLLAGLDQPSSGEVQLLGQSLSAMNEDERAAFRANNVGFVFQSFQLLPNLTAIENVMLPLELAGIAAEEPAKQMLLRVGLGARLNHYPTTLSGGEQQRVSIARAFVQKPVLIFADEPTGSLDETTGSKVIELMFELARQQNTTLILVTHDPSLAARCDRQLVLHSGRLDL